MMMMMMMMMRMEGRLSWPRHPSGEYAVSRTVMWQTLQVSLSLLMTYYVS